jgi:hypothetical protein
MNAIQKPLSDLKKCKPYKAFQGFGSGFTDLHTKHDADKMLIFASHPR